MPVLVQTLIDQIRLLSNLKNNQFYTDDDIGGFVNDAAMELDDLFTDAMEHYALASMDFTLAGSVASVALPTDFQKADILLRDPASTNPIRVDPLPNLAERGSSETGIPGLGRCYFIGGDALEILPASSAPGDYRLLYTPQLGQVWPSPTGFTVRLANAAALPSVIASAVVPGGAKGVGATLTGAANGALTVDSTAVAVGDRILLQNSAAFASPVFDGIYKVTTVGNGGAPFVLTRATDWDENGEIHVGASIKVTAGTANTGLTFRVTSFGGTIDVSAQTFATTVASPPVLPTRLLPWQLFIKVHAAIAIRQGRQQPTADLDKKLTEQRARAAKAAMNRTEGVTQAPIQRRRGGFWNNPIPGGTW